MSATTTKIYPKHQDDVEFEKEIIEEIQKLTPLGLKLKAFALNHQTLALKEIGTVEDQEIEALDAQAQKNFQQHIPNINDIINGTKKPTDEELKDFDKYFSDEEKAKKDELLANLKPIEGYWLTVLKNEAVLKTQISEDDEKGLAAVTRVEYKLSEDTTTPHNFTITFHFAPNEYFSNESASVYFHMKEPRDVTKTEGTAIEWKEGKNFTIKQVSKKQKNKKTGQTRTVTKEENVPSFFDFFKTLVAPDESKEELDEEEQQANEEILNQTDIAYSLIEEVIPFNLEYFLGVRKEFGEDGEFDDEDDEDDDEDDDEEEAPKAKGKKAAKPAAGGAGGAAGKQECKQQ